MAARPRRILGLALALAAVMAVAIAGLALWHLATTLGGEPLPVLGEVPAFTLVDQTGSPFGSSDLAGRPWVADFVFTHCPAICPRMTESMRQVDAALDAGSPVRLVSISVDPLRDRPAVLAAYAARHDASPRWRFLTTAEGEDPAAIFRLARDGMKLAVEPAPPTDPTGDQVLHSNRFVLVDAAGRIRGYYDPFDPAALERLMDDLDRLAD